jgi:hypothetical protein
MTALSGAYGRGYYFPSEMDMYAVSGDSRNQIEPDVVNKDGFLQATATREGAFSMPLENSERALGSGIAVYDPMPSTDEMSSLLVLLKDAEEGENSWIKMTLEDCKQQYQELMQRSSSYSTTSDDGFPTVNIACNEGHSRDVEGNVDGNKTESASDDKRSIKCKGFLKDGRMEWDERRDERLTSVLKKWQAGGRGYWAKVTRELNFEFGEDRESRCYEDRWRKLSRGIVDGVLNKEEQAIIKGAIQSGKYYKFSKEGVFEGVAYTDVGRLAHKTSAMVCKMLDKVRNKYDPFLKKLKAIEDRRKEGEQISQETLYKFLGEFAPKAEVSALEPSVT